MNKQELLDNLSAKFFRLGKVAKTALSETDIALREEEGVAWYMAGVYEESEGVLVRRNVPFYVVDEGEPTEAAFFGERKLVDTLPKTAITTFKEVVQTEINTKIAKGVLLKAAIEKVSEVEKYAVIHAYIKIADEVAEKRFLAYKNLTGILQVLPFVKE